MLRSLAHLPLLFAAGLALAHSGATGIVKERMEAMEDMAARMKVIVPMMRGRTAYDPEALSAAAARIADLGGPALSGMFPEGSDHGPSEAAPAIWSEFGRFEALAAELSLAARALSEAAATSDAPPRAAFAEMVGTCRACHESFCIESD